MSVHLVGGGWNPVRDPDVYGPFLSEASARAEAAGRMAPRIAVIVVGGDDPSGHAEKLETALSAAGLFEAVQTVLTPGQTADASALADVDGILVGGGAPADYLQALLPLAEEIRQQVTGQVPYLGYSAGAMIAAERAILGGWQIGGVEVCPKPAGEDLDEVVIDQGIGLIDVSIDVHAVQWGTLTRLVATTEAGLTDGGLAIDEGTALIVGEGALHVVGAGSVWRVSQTKGGVLVNTFGA
jgi:cyanophycinase